MFYVQSAVCQSACLWKWLLEIMQMNVNGESSIKCHCSYIFISDASEECHLCGIISFINVRSSIIELSLAFSACGPGGPGGPAFPGKPGGPWRHEGNSKRSWFVPLAYTERWSLFQNSDVSINSISILFSNETGYWIKKMLGETWLHPSGIDWIMKSGRPIPEYEWEDSIWQVREIVTEWWLIMTEIPPVVLGILGILGSPVYKRCENCYCVHHCYCS